MCKSFRTFCTIIGVYRRKVEGRSPCVIALLLFSIPHSFGDPSQPISTTYSTTDICLRWRFCLSVFSESARVGTFCTIIGVGGRGRGDGGGGGGLILLSLPSAGIRHVSSKFLHFEFLNTKQDLGGRWSALSKQKIFSVFPQLFIAHTSLFVPFHLFFKVVFDAHKALAYSSQSNLIYPKKSSETFLRIIWNTSSDNLEHFSEQSETFLHIIWNISPNNNLKHFSENNLKHFSENNLKHFSK